MSTASIPPTKPHVGPLRKVFPIVVFGLVVAVWIVAEFWPNTDVQSSNLSIAKMFSVMFGGALIFLWALRMPGWSKRSVWAGFLIGTALTLAIVKPKGMSGKFMLMWGPRDWVMDTFFGGSPDTVLERHRETQEKFEGGVDLTVQPGDWPEYRGPNRDGDASGQPIAKDWATSPPKELWRQPVGGGFSGFATANGFLVSMEQRRDREVVVCYEAATGREVWVAGWNARFVDRQGGDGPRATPTIAGGDVFVFGAAGRLVCLNGKDGSEKWAVETLEGQKNLTWGMCGSPLVVGERVIVNPGAQGGAESVRAVRAYDRSTGKELWASGDSGAGYSSPQLSTLCDQKQIVLFDAFGASSFDLDSGRILWRFPFKTDFDVNAAQPLVIGKDTLLIGAGYNHGGALLKIENTNGEWSAKEIWKSKPMLMRYKFANPVRREGHAYGLNDGILECIDLKTGNRAWKDDRRRGKGEAFGDGQILVCDDRIIALTEFGELVIVEASPDGYKEFGRVQALTKGTKTWNNPTLVGGRIYVRNDGEMACYDLTVARTVAK